MFKIQYEILKHFLVTPVLPVNYMKIQQFCFHSKADFFNPKLLNYLMYKV